jgi:hypothetical protein
MKQEGNKAQVLDEDTATELAHAWWRAEWGLTWFAPAKFLKVVVPGLILASFVYSLVARASDVP